MIKNFILLILSIVISVLLIEILLRLTDNDDRFLTLNSDEPIIYVEDKEIGWIQKEGKYKFPKWSNDGYETNFTVDFDGSRYSQINNISNEMIIFLGGSLTQGWAVDNKESFVSLFQKQNPEYKIKNFAVGGYGAYQSLLMQERILGYKKNIKVIVYGFIDHHELRNVAAGSWMYLLNKFSSRGHVKVPYASINEFDKIERHKAIEYIYLPFRKLSALVAKIEKKIMKLKSNQREKDKFIISKKIIQLMKINSEKINSEFIVLMLDNNEESFNNYKKYFLKEKINFVKCNFPAGEVVKGEGHPNAKAHEFVANCFNNYFAKLPL